MLIGSGITEFCHHIISDLAIDIVAVSHLLSWVKKELGLYRCEQVSPGQSMEGVLPNGLILGHAYSVTSVKQVWTLFVHLLKIKLRRVELLMKLHILELRDVICHIGSHRA